ncbi:MAG: hypothetical protein RSE02_07855 [Bacteroidales bacterium]
MKKQASIFIILLVSLAVGTITGQEKSELKMQADKLHKSYKFDEAIAIYQKMLEQSTDSLYKIGIENKLILSENGKALLEFACTPNVIANKKVAFEGFFLHYPGFKDKSWTPIPSNLLGELEKDINNAPVLYSPPGANTLVYSAKDNSESWNIFSTHKINDTLWSAPEILNENITSVGNEIFPILSRDGKALYFSSNGHYGMGGYDLYVSYWDEETNDWGVAQNMGFPFSSVGNDFLFYNTPDGLYSIFASDRDNTADDITIYAIDFENIPLKKSITQDQAEIISHLKVNSDILNKKHSSQNNNGDTTANKNGDEFSEYTLAVKSVRKLQQELRTILNTQKDSRELYSTLKNADDLALLGKKIAEQESKSLAIQQNLNVSLANLQKVEMDFLSKGIIITDRPENGNNTETLQVEEPKFVFANNTLGKVPILAVEQPIPELNLSFRILDEAVIANLLDFPTSLTYQIQLFVLANKAPLKTLKGLSPVFERKALTGKYIYSAGTFSTYADALKNINKVRKLGFSSAIITAYNNSKPLPLRNARILEQKEAEYVSYRVAIDGVETLSAESINVIRECTEKDIAKIVENGATRYVVGPFTKKAEADTLKEALDKIGIIGVQIEKIEKN